MLIAARASHPASYHDATHVFRVRAGAQTQDTRPRHNRFNARFFAAAAELAGTVLALATPLAFLGAGLE